MSDNYKKQFDQRFGAFQIPKEELERMFQLEMRMREDMMMLAEQAGGDGSTISAPGAGGPEQSVASGCIFFDVFTGISVNFGAEVTVSAATTFTVTWGDGEATTYTPGSAETVSVSHTYPESSQNYSAQMCFEDPTVVTGLEFFGDD